MMTKDVSITGNASAADAAAALPPGPAPAKSSKSDREFSSVMDQAASRKSAHTRTTRSSARGRGDAADSAMSRERVARAPRNDANARPVSRSAKPTMKGVAGELDDNRPSSKAAATETKVSAEAASTEEGVAAEESAETTQASSEEKSSTAETPTNIVPFPGQPVPTAVIIPFPLLAAQAATVETTADSASTEGEAATGSSSASQTSAAVSSANVIIPLPTAQATTARALPVPEGERPADDLDGIDVEKLGLRPVTSNETLATSASTTSEAAAAATVTAQENLESKIVSVAFRPAAGSVSEKKTRGSDEGSQLPSEPAERVESAAAGTLSESSAKIVLLRTDAAKAATDGASSLPGVVNARAAEITGTSVARQDVRMESTTTSEREAATAEQGEEALVRLPDVRSSIASKTEGPTTLPVRGLENDWQTTRIHEGAAYSESAATEVTRTDSTATVERISNLVVRETALVKKHGSDSMAVVLRPDAETELFVHLSQSNGQIEATIRCERGDAHQLGALWSQLQESLAQQKIKLAPLQETSGGNSNFNQSSGGSMTSGGQNGAREEARPEKQSMDDWPAPAVPATPAPHVRGTGGSRRRRITTSRPGWETWA